MTQPALGNKHICGSCDSRFYDLGKSPAICPKCGVAEKKRAKKHVAVPVIDDEPKRSQLDSETGLDLSDFDSDIDDDAGMPKGIDTIEAFDDAEHEIESLSELENREIHERQVGHDDTVEEEELLDTMKDGGLIVDDIDED